MSLSIIKELVTAIKIAEAALCRATFPGPRDQNDLNYAIDRLRMVLAKVEKTHGIKNHTANGG